MLGSSTACTQKGAGSVVKIRKKIRGRYTFSAYKSSQLKSLNSKAVKLSKTIKKTRVASVKSKLKAQLKDIKNASSKLLQCAQTLGQRIGCSISVEAPGSIEVAAGNSRAVSLSAQSGCSGTLEAEVSQSPQAASAEIAGLAVVVSVSAGVSSGSDSAVVRACSRNAKGYIEGCSETHALAINRCSLSAGTAPKIVAEHSSSNFELGASSDCSGGNVFSKASNPAYGSASVASSGGAVYSVGYFSGQDSFRYRVCDGAGAGCSEATVSLNVMAGPSFQGDENSLAPYRGHISREERLHLVRKIANNRFDLIEGDGASMPLGDLIDQRFMDKQFFAEDLKTAMKEIRNRGLLYGKPINTEEFIPNWRADFPAGDPATYKPILPASLSIESAGEVEYAFERWMMTTQRSWHSGNFRYHWGWDYTIANYLTKARYTSPLHARLLNFWMGHFGTSGQVINGFQENLFGYYIKTIERETFGNFRRLMLGDPAFSDSNGCLANRSADWRSEHGSILCDAMSNMWLSNHLNRGDNQNFARELMELYLMSPIDEVSGMRNYSEPGDIIGATRFVSGIRVDQWSQHHWLYGARFNPNPSEHSTVPATLFTELASANPALPIINQSMEPGTFVRHLLDQHPGVPRFIAGKLFASFVYPDPSDALVEELGVRLKELDYDLGAFLRIILTSEAMFSQRAAGRNCISSPLEVYSRVFNTIKMPLVVYENAHNAQPFYYSYAGLHRLELAGEVPAAYPSVFSYDYCGRDPGKDGSTSWLKSYLLVFRVTALVDLLNHHNGRFHTTWDFSKVVDTIREDPRYADGSPGSILAFFEEAMGLSLNAAERSILMEYLTHDWIGGAPVARPWNPADAGRMRAKIAGLIAILVGFTQSATH